MMNLQGDQQNNAATADRRMGNIHGGNMHNISSDRHNSCQPSGQIIGEGDNYGRGQNQLRNHTQTSPGCFAGGVTNFNNGTNNSNFDGEMNVASGNGGDDSAIRDETASMSMLSRVQLLWQRHNTMPTSNNGGVVSDGSGSGTQTQQQQQNHQNVAQLHNNNQNETPSSNAGPGFDQTQTFGQHSDQNQRQHQHQTATMTVPITVNQNEFNPQFAANDFAAAAHHGSYDGTMTIGACNDLPVGQNQAQPPLPPPDHQPPLPPPDHISTSAKAVLAAPAKTLRSLDEFQSDFDKYMAEIESTVNAASANDAYAAKQISEPATAPRRPAPGESQIMPDGSIKLVKPYRKYIHFHRNLVLPWTHAQKHL